MLRTLTIYYGLLQSAHLLTLLRAGIIFNRTRKLPFPVPPPAKGWDSQTIPFLIAMGLVDGTAFIMALIFSYSAVLGGWMMPQLGIISLTVAGASAALFAIGIFANRAWSAHPRAYGIMVVLFAPLLPLFILLLVR
ncbi:MAG: hypothetical protein R6U57_00970 [Anaerolineales bacterium]